jgi:hypothetical protein
LIYRADKKSRAQGKIMKIAMAIVCTVAFTTSATAQYGVSNARDGSGNLIRESGMNPSRNYGQAPVNNTNNTVNRTVLVPPPSTATQGKKTTR